MARLPRLVLFDLDGTLFDHRAAATAALTGWLAELDVTSTAELTQRWFALEDLHYAAALRGEITWPEQRRRRARDFCGVLGRAVDDGDAAADAVFATYWVRYSAPWSRGLYPDARAALTYLADRGIARGVLTNGIDLQQRGKIAAIGLEELCGPVLASDALGAAKPDPAAYRAACARLGVEPADVTMVGDNYDLDVVAARAAGLRAVHLDRDGSAGAPDVERIATLAGLGAHLGL